MISRIFRRTILCFLIIIAACKVVQSEPLSFRSPLNSIHVIFGDFDQWVTFDPNKSIDTTILDMQHDLIIVSSVDSLYVPRSLTPVTIQFFLPSGPHTEVFVFAEPIDSAEVALLHQYPRYSSDTLSAGLTLGFWKASDSALSELRSKYKLDSVAGSGSTASRAIRLLTWVHNSIRHDGSQENPAGTLLERFDKCTRGQATMNCGGLARALADVYAAVGYTSRTVVGLAYDTADFECHQWTELWSDEDQKWLFMDPTNNAYFTNSQGKLMQIMEVRQELALGDPSRRDEFIRINDDINWNGRPQEKMHYLNYMAKNLFRFRTWGYTSAPSDKMWTIELIPELYASLPAGLTEGESETVFRTHDASLFWMPPQVKGSK